MGTSVLLTGEPVSHEGDGTTERWGWRCCPVVGGAWRKTRVAPGEQLSEGQPPGTVCRASGACPGRGGMKGSIGTGSEHTGGWQDTRWVVTPQTGPLLRRAEALGQSQIGCPHPGSPVGGGQAIRVSKAQPGGSPWAPRGTASMKSAQTCPNNKAKSSTSVTESRRWRSSASQSPGVSR